MIELRFDLCSVFFPASWTPAEVVYWCDDRNLFAYEFRLELK